MAFGVLEPATGVQPSSTYKVESVDHAEIKIQVRVPRPSSSHLDPLNWSRLKKELLFATIILGSCFTGSLGPVLVPGFAVVAKDLDVNLTNVTLLNGSLVMALGVSSYFSASFSMVFGKRAVYLFTTVLLLVSCCWAAASKSYVSLLASRVFQGLGMGSFLALAGTASMNDVFFVQERGLRVGLWNLGFIASVNLTPVISGYVISNMSWRWSFWFEAIMYGILLVAVLICFPETSFIRHSCDVSVTETIFKEGEGKERIVAINPNAPERSRLWAYWGIGLDSVMFPDRPNLIIACIKPWYILIHPIVAWECVMWAVVFTWTILVGAVASQIFTAAPFNMSTVAVGNLAGIAPFLGSAIGTSVGGLLCDFCGRSLARRNSGTYEPEFRLWVMPLATVTMAIGTFGLGAAIEQGLSPVVCGVFLAILNFAVGMGCTGIVAYTNDVAAERAGDAFGLAMVNHNIYVPSGQYPMDLTCLQVIKSAFAFGLSFVFNQYLAQVGPLKFFSTFGGVTVAVMLTHIPIYVFGKRIRAWSEHHNLFHRTGNAKHGNVFW
ncbi:hypothetical protein PENANT_c035G04522 [Penicillium antarcticum]|uniref:Major facilitator superfamily (MFS) profile domain-containing protein n=1 Tax=Penicillium antarcticum TaxID=416450 RepID=A0A1V6PU24_9EURO|nr:uncharacterized protein N7508_009958 [Penicillium antarcticum]KAJ5295137.1 hypothetical protein N7508_009958 [Penicillium antarcticum]OQD80534.1 hypothetical protein PENANT_c035G04522 [Penicillium antarcticum]